MRDVNVESAATVKTLYESKKERKVLKRFKYGAIFTAFTFQYRRYSSSFTPLRSIVTRASVHLLKFRCCFCSNFGLLSDPLGARLGTNGWPLSHLYVVSDQRWIPKDCI